jgi:hypothetical protein
VSCRIAWCVAALVAIGGAGCSQFDPPSYVGGFRVLGLKGEPPDVAPGATSTLEALVTAPADDLQWDLCRQVAVATQGETISPDCVSADTAPYLTPLGHGSTVSVTMPPDVTPDQLGAPDSTLGFYLPIRLRARSGGQTITAFYSLRLTTPPLPANQNPQLADIVVSAADGTHTLVDGTPLPVQASDTLTLQASVTPDSYEHYPLVDPVNQTATDTVEQIRFFWFTTAGELAHDITGNDNSGSPQTLTFQKHAPAPGTTIDLWVVARDERGGTDYTHRTLLISP